MRLEAGITVMPEYVQAEGVEAVLDRVADLAGATSVTTSPYVVAVASEGVGHREPPADAEAGRKRLLDRPLWGMRELWMNAASSFAPDLARYRGLAYRPPETDATTEADGPVVGAFLDAAGGRGLRPGFRSRRPFRRVTGFSSAGRMTRTSLFYPTGGPSPGGWTRTRRSRARICAPTCGPSSRISGGSIRRSGDSGSIGRNIPRTISRRCSSISVRRSRGSRRGWISRTCAWGARSFWRNLAMGRSGGGRSRSMIWTRSGPTSSRPIRRFRRWWRFGRRS